MTTIGEKNAKFPIFKERFSKLRGGKTLREFAQFLDLSLPTVGFYENGDRVPDALTLARIAKRCSVPADYLIGLTNDEKRIPSAVDKLGLTQDAVSVLSDLCERRTRGEKLSVKDLKAIDLARSKETAAITQLLSNAKSAAFVENLYKTTDHDEIKRLWIENKVDEITEFIKEQSVFSAGLVLDIVSLMIENEETLDLLLNLATYVYTSTESSAGAEALASFGLVPKNGGSDRGVLFFTPEQLAGLSLLDAENSLRKLRDMHGKYVVNTVSSADNITQAYHEEDVDNGEH